jgi:hypothetical protein
MKKFILFFVILNIVLFCSCHSSSGTQDQFDYIKFKDFKFTPAVVKPGAALQIIGYSGGETPDKNEIYYFQFICVNRDNGDTIKVLASMIDIDTGDGKHGIFTPAYQYDWSKGATDALFLPLDSVNQTLEMMESLISATTKNDGQNIVDTSFTKNISDTTAFNNRPKYVIVNEQYPAFSDTSYKAVAGVLVFKQQPW